MTRQVPKTTMPDKTWRGRHPALSCSLLSLLLLLLLFGSAGSQSASEDGDKSGLDGGEEVACPSTCTCRKESVRCERSNSMKAVPASLPDNDTLQELVITFGQFKVVNASAFRNLRSLQRLELTNDNIDFLADGALKDLSELETLILRRNYLKTLFNETFVGLGKLKVLVLSYNLVVQLNNSTFRPLVELEVLDLARNRISLIASDAFGGLSKLKVLNLTRNDLLVVSSYLAPMPSLEVLILDDTNITMVLNKSFAPLKKLKRLTLTGNRLLTTLPPDAFVSKSVPGPGYIDLEELSLKGTSLTEVPVKALEGLNMLKSFDLSQTNIVRIRRGSFERLSNLVTLTMANLKSLTTIEEDAFSGLRNLEHLVISNSRNLTGLSPRLFRELSGLKYLDLHNNGLETLNQLQANWKSIDVVDLSGNPVRCDCHAAWMLLFLLPTATYNSSSAATGKLSASATSTDNCSQYQNEQYREHHPNAPHSSDGFTRLIACSAPSQLRDRCLASLSPEDLRCESRVAVTTPPKKKRSNDYRFRVGIITSVICVVILFTCLLVVKFRTRLISLCRRQYRYKHHKYREQNGGSLSSEIVELETTQLEDFESDIDTSMKP